MSKPIHKEWIYLLLELWVGLSSGTFTAEDIPKLTAIAVRAFNENLKNYKKLFADFWGYHENDIPICWGCLRLKLLIFTI